MISAEFRPQNSSYTFEEVLKIVTVKTLLIHTPHKACYQIIIYGNSIAVADLLQL